MGFYFFYLLPFFGKHYMYKYIYMYVFLSFKKILDFFFEGVGVILQQSHYVKTWAKMTVLFFFDLIWDDGPIDLRL